MKTIISLNSHSLSSFQRCEQAYCFAHLIGLRSNLEKPALKRGTLVARFLNLHYYNRLRPKQLFNKTLANVPFWVAKIQKDLSYSPDEAFKLFHTLMKYRLYYKDETWVPLIVERGFSKILYEDEENCFIYEGSIDLKVRNNQEILVVDHKTESSDRPIYEFNNQAIGYLWATGATQFVYNYLTLTKEPKFHRRTHPFHENQIEEWKSNTIKWFKRVKKALEEKEFLRSLNCTGIYGVCPYHLICEQPNPKVKDFIIQTNYKKERPYKSW